MSEDDETDQEVAGKNGRKKCFHDSWFALHANEWFLLQKANRNQKCNCVLVAKPEMACRARLNKKLNTSFQSNEKDTRLCLYWMNSYLLSVCYIILASGIIKLFYFVRILYNSFSKMSKMSKLSSILRNNKDFQITTIQN